MASVHRSDIVDMGGNSLNMKSEIERDDDDDIEMETDDEDIRAMLKGDDKSVNDEAEEGELVDCREEGLNEDPVFVEHRPLSRPNFPPTEPGKPLLKILEENAFSTVEKKFENRSGGFVTGVDIFSAEEQEKLTKRAQRFGIDPSEARTLTQKLLKSLYKSMGVTPGDVNIRFDALHMRGTEEMNTQDVLIYFKDYAPASIEWLSSSSCNVMWLDDISAARALLGLSVKIKNVKQRESSTRRRRRKSVDNDSVEDATMDEEEEDESDKDEDDDNEECDAVSVSELCVPMPPGLWRKGVPHPRSKCIFLRFATREDRRAPQVGRANTQDFQGYIGLISESKKRRFQEQLGGIVFYDTGDEVFHKKLPDDAANPWSAIAYSWGAFDRNRNKIRNDSPPKRPTPPPSPVFMNHYDQPFRPDLGDIKKRRFNLDHGHSSSSEDWIKRRKLPRMRMHADDEIKEVERRLGHSRSKRHSERSDLRSRLDDRDREMIIIKKEKSSSSKENTEDENEVEVENIQPEDEDEVPDLRVAIVTDRSPSPEDNKEDVWKSGQVKSVLRGARAHDDSVNHGNDDDRRVKSSIRKHRSRSRERHHRSRRRKEPSRRHHSHSSGVLYSEHEKSYRQDASRHYNEEYDSDEIIVQPNAQDLRAKISKKKPDRDRERDRDRRHRIRSHKDRDSDRRERMRSDSRDKNETFRAKSPLQIEIDNDEYYKLIESD